MKNNTLLIVLGVLGAAVAAFFFWNKSKSAPTATRAAAPPQPAMDSTQAYLAAGTSLFSDILARL